MSKESFVVEMRVDGDPMTIKLRPVGAMMIAGDNNVGLPNMMDSIIASLLSQYDSNSLKLILLDPKQVCPSAYKDFLHTFCYETDVTKEIDVLRWVVNEMDFRYDEMAKAKVRNVDEYNKKNISGKMSEIVVAIDEIFDHYEELEPLIVRLAQKNCATTGIHIIYSTIRPDKITTLLKGCSEIKAVFELDDENVSRRLLSECRFHYYKVDSDKLKQKLPFFSSIKLDYGKVRNVEKGWECIILGLGIIYSLGMNIILSQ